MTLDPGALMELQLRAADAERLRDEVLQLRTQMRAARRLMTQMNDRYASIKGTERRLLEQVVICYRVMLAAERSPFFWLLPKDVKQWIRANAR